MIDVIKIGNRIVLIQSYIPNEILQKIPMYCATNGIQVNSVDCPELSGTHIFLNGERKKLDYIFISSIYNKDMFYELKEQCIKFNEHYKKILAS